MPKVFVISEHGEVKQVLDETLNPAMDVYVINADKILENVCPVCGTKQVEAGDESTTCPKCGLELVDFDYEDAVNVYLARLEAQCEGHVDVITSGYEWICPWCDTLNKEIEIKPGVICSRCQKVFDVYEARHAE